MFHLGPCRLLAFILFPDTSILSTAPSSPVVKKEFLSWFNVPLSVDTDAMVSVDHHDLGKAVRVYGVVSKPDLVPFASSIHDKVWGREGKGIRH